MSSALWVSLLGDSVVNGKIGSSTTRATGRIVLAEARHLHSFQLILTFWHFDPNNSEADFTHASEAKMKRGLP